MKISQITLLFISIFSTQFYFNTNLVAQETNHSNLENIMSINDFENLNSALKFSYNIIPHTFKEETKMLIGKIENISNEKLIIATSPCIGEANLVVIQNQNCIIEPIFLCGYVVCKFMIFEPGATYQFNVGLDCAKKNDNLEINFKVIEPSDLCFEKVIFGYSEFGAKIEKYNSRMISGKRDTNLLNNAY